MILKSLTSRLTITAVAGGLALGLFATTASANHCPYKSAHKSYGMPYGKYQGYGPMYRYGRGHGYGYGKKRHGYYGHGKKGYGRYGHGKMGHGYYGHGMKGYGMKHPHMWAYGADMYDHGAKNSDEVAKAAKPAKKDVVDTAIAAGKFTTLVKAVQAADLVDLLKADGPYTVFAPTDEAFANLPEGKLDALLADKEKLTAVLKYHVVPGNLSAADILQAGELNTAEGQTLAVEDIEVAKADVKASNGTIHVIDAVLVPKM